MSDRKQPKLLEIPAKGIGCRLTCFTILKGDVIHDALPGYWPYRARHDLNMDFRQTAEVSIPVLISPY